MNHITLHLLVDGTSDLLVMDDQGWGLPEPYDAATMRDALDRVQQAVDGYRTRYPSVTEEP